MLESYFPHGMAPYLIGGLLIGAGVALLYVTTGRLGGASTFLSAAWSYLLQTSFFRQSAQHAPPCPADASRPPGH